MRAYLLGFIPLLFFPGSGEAKVCQEVADIAFVIDSSSSIWIYNFYKQLEFINDLVKKFTISKTDVHISALTFAARTDVQFYFNEYDTSSAVVEKISNISHANGDRTLTDDGLRVARTVLFSAKNGARDNVPRICFVLTDGKSENPKATKAEAQTMKDAGIKIFAVGIGKSVNAEEMKAMVSPPASETYIQVETFGELVSVNMTSHISTKLCDVNECKITMKDNSIIHWRPGVK